MSPSPSAEAAMPADKSAPAVSFVSLMTASPVVQGPPCFAASYYAWPRSRQRAVQPVIRPDIRQATLFNDIAIALFVLDVFLVMIG
jgi:hypothetical protein